MDHLIDQRRDLPGYLRLRRHLSLALVLVFLLSELSFHSLSMECALFLRKVLTLLQSYSLYLFCWSLAWVSASLWLINFCSLSQ